jgi:polyisoprenoid-binding protein YceI
MSTLSEQAVSIPGTGTYHLDPSQSTITFATKHLFGLGKVTGTA